MKASQSSAQRRRRRSRSGFTLLEILLAIALMIVIAGVMGVGFGNLFEKNQANAADMFVRHGVKANLTQYRMDMGSYPSTADGLAVLLEAPAGEKARRWKGPYADELPDDPWGNPYQYAYPGTRNKTGYDLWSLGPDGIPSDDDIGNW